MSDLQLSPQMISEIESVIIQQDQQAQDPGIMMQYLAAVIGYRLGQMDMGGDDKEEFLGQLCGFVKHVFDDVEGQNSAPPPPAEDAFGIWTPDAS